MLNYKRLKGHGNQMQCIVLYDLALSNKSIKDILRTPGRNVNIILVLDDIKYINTKLKIVDGKGKTSYQAFQITFWYYQKAII